MSASLALAALLVALQEPQLREIVLDGAWEVGADPEDVGVAQRWFEPGATGEWARIYVPDPAGRPGTVWFRRRVEVPADWNGSRVRLVFEAVAGGARVWWNGAEPQPDTVHRGAFALDAGAARPGPDNALVLRVVGNPAAVWQPVRLRRMGAARIDDVRIETDLERRRATAAVRVVGGAGAPARLLLLGTIAPHGQTQSIASAGGEAQPGGAEAVLVFEVPDAQPWEPGRPALYDLRLELQSLEGGPRPDDRTEVVKFDSSRPVLLRALRHEGLAPGMKVPAPTMESVRRELEPVRRAGFNALLFEGQLVPRALRSVADELGLVIQPRRLKEEADVCVPDWPDRLRLAKVPAFAEDPRWERQRGIEEELAADFGRDLRVLLLNWSQRAAMMATRVRIETLRRTGAASDRYVAADLRLRRPERPAFLDEQGRPRVPPEEWAEFQGDTLLLLGAESDAGNLVAGEEWMVPLFVSHYGREALPWSDLTVTVAGGGLTAEALPVEGATAAIQPGTKVERARLRLRAAAMLERPALATVGATLLRDRRALAAGRRDFRVYPRPERPSDAGLLWSPAAGTIPPGSRVLVTERLNDDVMRFLEGGGRVCFVAAHADGPPARQALGRAPFGVFAEHPVLARFPHDRTLWPALGGLLEGAPRLWDRSQGAITPIVVVLDCLGLERIDPVFETTVGAGRLIVTALRHEANPAGEWLLCEIARYLLRERLPPAAATPPGVVRSWIGG